MAQQLCQMVKTHVISTWSNSDKVNKSHGNFNHDIGDQTWELNDINLKLPNAALNAK